MRFVDVLLWIAAIGFLAYGLTMLVLVIRKAPIIRKRISDLSAELDSQRVEDFPLDELDTDAAAAAWRHLREKKGITRRRWDPISDGATMLVKRQRDIPGVRDHVFIAVREQEMMLTIEEASELCDKVTKELKEGDEGGAIGISETGPKQVEPAKTPKGLNSPLTSDQAEGLLKATLKGIQASYGSQAERNR